MQSISVSFDITKVDDFQQKKCWCQQNLRDVSSDL